MILKSYIVEGDINQINEFNCVLFYGENSGIQEDIRNKIKQKNKEIEFINLFQSEIIKNNNSFYTHTDNVSLFGNKKIIFIFEANDKILEILKNHKLNNDAKIIIFTNILDKKSKLRAFFEKEKDFAVIPCYQDNERTLTKHISSKINMKKGLNQEIINIIINNSHMDRKIINEEIKKINGFFIDKPIDKEKLLELLNVKINTDFDKIRDAIFMCNKTKANSLLGEIEFLQEDIFIFINKLNNRTKKLIEIINIYENTKNYEMALEMLKPKVFWKDKPVFLEQLTKWNGYELSKVLEIVSKTELLMKKNSYIKNEVIIKNLLVDICCKTFNRV